MYVHQVFVGAAEKFVSIYHAFNFVVTTQAYQTTAIVGRRVYTQLPTSELS